jgi:hypothetical protein
VQDVGRSWLLILAFLTAAFAPKNFTLPQQQGMKLLIKQPPSHPVPFVGPPFWRVSFMLI